MATPKKKPKVREDLNQLAARIVAEATGAKPKTPDPDAGKDPAAGRVVVVDQLDEFLKCPPVVRDSGLEDRRPRGWAGGAESN
jgi:hypothetical protein